MYTGSVYFYCDLQVWLHYKILPANRLRTNEDDPEVERARWERSNNHQIFLPYSLCSAVVKYGVVCSGC